MSSAGRYGSDINRLIFFRWESSCQIISYKMLLLQQTYQINYLYAIIIHYRRFIVQYSYEMIIVLKKYITQT